MAHLTTNLPKQARLISSTTRLGRNPVSKYSPPRPQGNTPLQQQKLRTTLNCGVESLTLNRSRPACATHRRDPAACTGLEPVPTTDKYDRLMRTYEIKNFY